MQRLNRAARLPQTLSRTGALGAPALTAIDVGVSGGVHPVCRLFEGARVIGIDPNQAEIDRLTAAALPGETYLAAFMGAPDFQRPFPPPGSPPQPGLHTCDPYRRSSAFRANVELGVDWTCQIERGEYRPEWPKEVLSLDQLAERHGLDRVDFIKIDTDGADYEVLTGGRHILGRTLAVQVEAQFNGPLHPQSNLFCNIDLFLRQQGFFLFDMDVWRYSRAALPSPFLWDAPMQTTRGQAVWGDVLYLRDLGASPAQADGWAASDLLRLAALFEAFGLADCAAEILLTHGGGALPEDQTRPLLELLVPGQGQSYDDYLAAWRHRIRERRFR